MASVKSGGNKTTEVLLAAKFRLENLSGWRRHYPLAGNPDFSFPKQKLAVFVDGCFWHRCPKHCRMPSTNREYWTQKIDRNLQRDSDVTRDLRKKEWGVVRFWEHDLCGGPEMSKKMKRLKEIVRQEKSNVRDKPHC